MKRNVFLRVFIDFFVGVIVGIGAILPGVSGGVLSVVFGIYEPMMELLTRPLSAAKKYYRMFIPFGIGWLVGLLLLAKGVGALFAFCEPVAVMLFFGLIFGSLPDLFKLSEKSDAKKSWTPFVFTLAAASILFQILKIVTSITIPPSFFSFMFCGTLWGFSTIVPGFDSSALLICFGLYEPMTVGIGSVDPRVVVPMVLGIAITIFSLARLLDMLFKRHYAIISRIVLGFVVASSIKVIPDNFGSTWMLVASLVCFVLGFAVARGMDIVQNKYNKKMLEKGESS